MRADRCEQRAESREQRDRNERKTTHEAMMRTTTTVIGTAATCTHSGEANIRIRVGKGERITHHREGSID